MPKYSSQQEVKSGLPIGGIGAGKLEIFPSGVLDNFTFLNNPNNPFTNSTKNERVGVLGYHFAVSCWLGKKNITRILQTVKISDYPTVEDIDFDGCFPFAILDYKDSQLPLKVHLKAFSFFIPKQEKDSCLPAGVFEFTLTNLLNRSIEGAFLVNVRNIVGQWCVGRFNQVIDESDMISLNMQLKKPTPFDVNQGSMSVAIFKSNNYEISFLGEYNLMPKAFRFNSQDIRLEAIDILIKSGQLPNINSEIPVNSESVELAGALAVNFKLKAKGKITIPVVFSWNFPVCLDGHIYSNYFRNSREVLRYVHSNFKQLKQATEDFVITIKKLPLPDWLQDALLNNLYTFFSSTVWTKQARFAFFESPEVCPLMGTLDVRFYSSVALALLFPRLEENEIRQFADMQRAQGYIPHDLGRMRLDMPSISTNHLYWKDLNPKFILMVYRDYLWKNDLEFLKKMFPFVKKAFFWIISTDKNKDYLPDNEGADHTFDLWPCYGVSAYTSSVFLASLLALLKICEILDDKDTKKLAAEYFLKGRKNFEKKLWHKHYFIEYNNRGNRNNSNIAKVSQACSMSQLIGQWYSSMLGLDYIVSKIKIKKAIETIFKLNAADSSYGITHSVFYNGERNKESTHTENIWIGISYGFLSLAIYEGFEREALEIAKRMWTNISERQLNTWNQPDIYSSSSGEFLFGDHYMRNLSIWSLLIALSKKNKPIQNFLKDYINLDVAS